MIPPGHIRSSIQFVTDAVAARAAGLLLRNPAIDPRCPQASDLDFVVLADIDDMRSERLRLTLADGSGVMADLTWLPWTWVEDPRAAATRGWIPHRLLTSDVVWDPGRSIATLCRDISRQMYVPELQRQRIAVFLDTGFQTVREIGITRDFPALALFWLHMAHTACLAALADGSRLLCPNVYTRPFDYVDGLEARGHQGLRRQWIEALRLDEDLESLILRLRRCHAQVTRRFPEPRWRDSISAGTRYEFRYWSSPHELEWRIHVAQELERCDDSAAATFYLRFCAYAVSRIPVVHARALEGWSVSFLRPEQAMLPELQRLAPDLISDISLMLAGDRELDEDDVQNSLARLLDFRDDVGARLQAQGIAIGPLKTWEPYQPAAA